MIAKTPRLLPTGPSRKAPVEKKLAPAPIKVTCSGNAQNHALSDIGENTANNTPPPNDNPIANERSRTGRFGSGTVSIRFQSFLNIRPSYAPIAHRREMNHPAP